MTAICANCAYFGPCDSETCQCKNDADHGMCWVHPPERTEDDGGARGIAVWASNPKCRFYRYATVEERI